MNLKIACSLGVCDEIVKRSGDQQTTTNLFAKEIVYALVVARGEMSIEH